MQTSGADTSTSSAKPAPANRRFLLNLIAQDLAAGEGLALLDPHGDLAEAVLMQVPKNRTNDLVYIDPADTARPIGFNPLSSVPDDLKPIVADGVVSAFRHVWPESWLGASPRLQSSPMRSVPLLDVPGRDAADAPPTFDRRRITAPAWSPIMSEILSSARSGRTSMPATTTTSEPRRSPPSRTKSARR